MLFALFVSSRLTNANTEYVVEGGTLQYTDVTVSAGLEVLYRTTKLAEGVPKLLADHMTST